MELRPYQQNALDAIRQHFASGLKKVLLHMATGGGKTLIFCQVLKGAHERGRRALMVVRGRKLVDQASRRLDREGVDHGVMMAGHWRRRPVLPIQIASIDTLYARRNKEKLPDFDLIVLDEAHYATSPSFLWLIEQYPDVFLLPVTATPHVKGGLQHIAEVVVYPISIKELIEQNYLVPPVYYAPSKPNLGNVRIDRKTGDYRLDELSEAMQKTNLYGDMVKSYQKHASGLATLLFCVDVKHSKAVCETFISAGITAEHIDAAMPEKERNEVIERLETGVTKVITNVGIFTTGVDIPCLRCIMLARPTKSYNLYIQILGRGTRLYPGKENFIVLDHADCVAEHGFIANERKCKLEGEAEVKQKPVTVTCQVCYHIWDPIEQWERKNPDLFAQGKFGRDYICEGRLGHEICGFDNQPVKVEVVESQRKAVVDEEYELTKVDEHGENVNESNVKLRIRALVDMAVSRGYAKPAGWVYHQIKMDKKFGGVVANQSYKFIHKVCKEYV